MIFFISLFEIFQKVTLFKNCFYHHGVDLMVLCSVSFADTQRIRTK